MNGRYGGGRYGRGGGGGFRGGRGRGGGRAGGSVQPLKGLFADNIWHCDCAPRLPAEHFKVKKEGKNQGRWFYTCQNRNKGPGANQGGCDFFLWDEDAKLREEATVMSNSRGERSGLGDVQEGWNAGRNSVPGKGLFKSGGHDSETDSPSPMPTPASAANVRKKRNARDASLDDNDFDMKSDEEQELAQLVDTSSFETPQKAPKTGVYATPATTVHKSSRKLPWVEETAEPTSPTSARRTVIDYFTTPSKPQPKAVAFAEEPASSEATTEGSMPRTPQPQDSATTPALPASPSPSSRYKDALIDPADSASSLTSEVLAELSTINMPREKIEKIRSILSKHDLKTQGVTKGRDISRLAIKAKGAKIVELEAKIASLEAEREVDRSMMARLKWKKETGQEEVEEEDESQL